MPPKQRKSPPAKEEKSELDDDAKKSVPSKKESGLSFKRSFSRFLLCLLILGIVYFFSNKKELTFASQTEVVERRAVEVPCSADYEHELTKFKGCAPKRCGRLVTDTLVSPEEASHLLKIAKQGMSYGGSSGGATILDLHSGALSQGKRFVNIYSLKSKEGNNIFSEEDFAIYRKIKNKIHHLISMEYGIPPDILYLTYPTFFSRMTSKPAQTVHDEYWSVHIDKQTYESFHYTSLVYLSDYNIDFTGGRFVFIGDQSNVTVEPKLGRVSVFTPGSENPHFVEKVFSGTRYAITVSFTCDKHYSIPDPSMEKINGDPNLRKS